MFVPLHHPPGHAQADFGEASVVIGGVERTAHFFAFDLPHSDASFVRRLSGGDGRGLGGRPRPRLRVLRSGSAVGALRQRPLPGGAHPARRDPQAGHALQRVPVALPDPRPLRSARQGQRQGGRRGAGRLGAAHLHGAAAALRHLGGPQRSGSRGNAASARRRSCGVTRRRSARGWRAICEAMADLPAAPFDACDQATGRVSSQALVRYKTNDYSVPVAYGHRDVWVRGLRRPGGDRLWRRDRRPASAVLRPRGHGLRSGPLPSVDREEDRRAGSGSAAGRVGPAGRSSRPCAG